MNHHLEGQQVGSAEYTEMTLNILGYQEDGEWVALALEMDLRGYGKTWEEAVGELRDLVFMQISFALSKSQPEMIWNEAEERYWVAFREVRRTQLFPMLANRREKDRRAGGMSIPPHVIEAQQDQFMRANG